MKINWVVSRDKSKALMNDGDLEVLIKKVDLEKDTLEKSILSNKCISTLGFKKLDSGNSYNIIVVKNNISSYIDIMNSEDIAKFTSKLCSKLGDIFEEE